MSLRWKAASLAAVFVVGTLGLAPQAAVAQTFCIGPNGVGLCPPPPPPDDDRGRDRDRGRDHDRDWDRDRDRDRDRDHHRDRDGDRDRDRGRDDRGWEHRGPPPGGDRRHRDACSARYRSYDPGSDTFLGFDGRRHRCTL